MGLNVHLPAARAVDKTICLFYWPSRPTCPLGRTAAPHLEGKNRPTWTRIEMICQIYGVGLLQDVFFRGKTSWEVWKSQVPHKNLTAQVVWGIEAVMRTICFKMFDVVVSKVAYFGRGPCALKMWDTPTFLTRNLTWVRYFFKPFASLLCCSARADALFSFYRCFFLGCRQGIPLCCLLLVGSNLLPRSKRH